MRDLSGPAYSTPIETRRKYGSGAGRLVDLPSLPFCSCLRKSTAGYVHAALLYCELYLIVLPLIFFSSSEHSERRTSSLTFSMYVLE